MSYPVKLDDRAALWTVPGPDRLFELAHDFTFEVGPWMQTIPEGFVTDLASVPSLGEWFISNDAPTILRAALAHDFLYVNHGAMHGRLSSFTRAECDDILRCGMLVCGASWIKRQTVYLAVRLGGGIPWANHFERKSVMRSRKGSMRYSPKQRILIEA